MAVAQTIESASTEQTATTLSGDAAGIWELETGWGTHLLNLREGTVYLLDNL